MTDPISREAAISAVGIHKTYTGGDGSLLEVLKGVDLEVHPGETVAIIGESGSGKSTLLHLLGGLDRPTAGTVRVGGQAVPDLDEDALSRLRNESIGFVFQFHHLLREFTVVENVMMPQLIAGRSRSAASDRARELLRDVGLEARLEHKPTQLSGGEQQRVAVARALANQPLALLADEPSGNLDPGTSDRLHDLLFGVGEAHDTAIVLVTHNMQLASRSDRILEVQDGLLVAADAAAVDYPRRSIG
ncbi:MAG: ABC transporter ATP-binding protein [Gemmatimonadota bacterium]